MRSQVIKIRNLPESTPPVWTIQVKPVPFLFALMALGCLIMYRTEYMSAAGMFLVMIPVFSLIVMPDRKLVSATEDYMVLYNQRDRDLCMLIYWDEIVRWHYEWHPSCDLLVVQLVDGRSEQVEMFSKYRIAKLMNLYAPGKEIKTARTKEERL